MIYFSLQYERVRKLNEQRVYKHIETDDSDLVLHDCTANMIQLENGILTFYFKDGFWVTPSHRANQSSETVRTDYSQVDYYLNDDVWVYVFRKNIFGKTVRTEWTLEKLIGLINNNTYGLEFLYQYKNSNEHLLKCQLNFDKEPYHYECMLEIPATEVKYRWNSMYYDRTW